MKLITEIVEDVRYIAEEKIDEETGQKRKYMFLEGPFIQCEIKNRNGRMYPKPVVATEVARYTKELIEDNRAYGELGHPKTPSLNADRISHLIVSLKEDGNNYIGRAKLLDTPMGKIARSIVEGGGKIGMSTRAVGTLKESNGVGVVQNDFRLSTAGDIVLDPSAPDAFVNGIMEGVEWVWENGVLQEQKVESYRNDINKAARTRTLTVEKQVSIFENFLNAIKAG